MRERKRNNKKIEDIYTWILSILFWGAIELLAANLAAY